MKIVQTNGKDYVVYQFYDMAVNTAATQPGDDPFRPAKAFGWKKIVEAAASSSGDHGSFRGTTLNSAAKATSALPLVSHVWTDRLNIRYNAGMRARADHAGIADAVGRIRPVGSRENSPAIHRRVGERENPHARPGGTVEA